MTAPHDGPAGSTRHSGRDIVFMILAVAVAMPWLALRFQGYHGDPALVAALIIGLNAFLLIQTIAG